MRPKCPATGNGLGWSFGFGADEEFVRCLHDGSEFGPGFDEALVGDRCE